MKKVFVIQSIPYVLKLIKATIGIKFPHLNETVFYESNFEKTLEMIPQNEEIVVIASDGYHDDEDVRFKYEEKDGSKLAEEIKKINSKAEVYIFSSYEPRGKFIDGYFPKSTGGDDTLNEIVEIFKELKLV
jgi:hypothetical protein